jgi:hypothetical protein
MSKAQNYEIMEAPSAVQAVVTAEIDRQIATAKQHPRDVKQALKDAAELATLTEPLARECMYALQRKDAAGKKVIIEGPSIRLAEIIAATWGNCRYGSRVVEEGREFVTAQGFFADLQQNTAMTFEVKRRITTRSGARFGSDMIAVTANAACSIAMRNAILKGIPKPIWEAVYQQTRKVALGDARSLPKRRDAAIDFFVKAGAAEADVLAFLSIEHRTDITLEHLGVLYGLAEAIKAGEVEAVTAFKPAAGEREAITLQGDDYTDVGTVIENGAKAKGEAAAPAQGEGQGGGEGAVVSRVAPEGERDSPATGENAAAPADGSDAEEDIPSDLEIVAQIEGAKPITKKAAAVEENRGALARIAETAEGDLAKRAGVLLRNFPSKG